MNEEMVVWNDGSFAIIKEDILEGSIWKAFKMSDEKSIGKNDIIQVFITGQALIDVKRNKVEEDETVVGWNELIWERLR